MGQYVGATTAHSPAQTNTAMSHVRWLYRFPVFRDAAHEGTLTTEHLRALRKLDNPRTTNKLHDWQQFFVDAAVEQTSFENFLIVCDTWFVHTDPDGEEPKDQINNNSVKFARKAGGRGTMTAEMDALTFAAVKKIVFDAAAKVASDHEDREVGSFANPVATTEAGRRLAGLVEVLTAGAAREDGTFAAPLLNIVMSQKVAEWAIDQLANPNAQPGPVPVHPFDIDGRCELIDGTIIHPLLAAAMCGFHRFDVPTLRRYIMNADSRIVDYSFSTRFHPEHLRTASLVEHRGRCATTGCMYHDILQMDHNEPHSHGGETKLSNTQPMCPPDNGTKADTTGLTRYIDRDPPKRRKRRSKRPGAPDSEPPQNPDP